MTRTRAGRPYHIGLTPEAIIDVAVEATRDAGLESWSVRDLARRLDVATASLYHHVGGQELLRRSVVERVLTMVGFPTRVLPWREWFRAALFPARPVLAGHPGTARWLLLHGPAFPAMIPVVDAGIASLRRAGFGADTAKAYAALFNTALMTIASADDRAAHTRSAGRDHEALMGEFEVVVLLIALSVVIEVIQALTGYRSRWAGVISYIVFAVWYVGPLLPLYYDRAGYFSSMAANGRSEVYSRRLDEFLTTGVLVGYDIGVVVLGLVSGVIALNLLRKNFERAGLA